MAAIYKLVMTPLLMRENNGIGDVVEIGENQYTCSGIMSIVHDLRSLADTLESVGKVLDPVIFLEEESEPEPDPRYGPKIPMTIDQLLEQIPEKTPRKQNPEKVKRDKKILKMFKEGYTRREIATAMGINYHMVYGVTRGVPVGFIE